MSFIMDLPPDVETRYYTEAGKQGIDRQEAARRLIAVGLKGMPAAAAFPAPSESEARRLAAIDEAFGSLSHLGGDLVEELRRERQADNERDARSYGVTL